LEVDSSSRELTDEEGEAMGRLSNFVSEEERDLTAKTMAETRNKRKGGGGDAR